MAALRRLLASARSSGSPVAAPGAWNALVARAIESTGFEAAYVSGGATANGAGFPDVGLYDRGEFVRQIREVTGAVPSVPVLVDADTGFGETEAVARTVVEYARAGAAGLHLEDQLFPKRCGSARAAIEPRA